jgi:hypothetical protein
LGTLRHIKSSATVSHCFLPSPFPYHVPLINYSVILLSSGAGHLAADPGSAELEIDVPDPGSSKLGIDAVICPASSAVHYSLMPLLAVSDKQLASRYYWYDP